MCVPLFVSCEQYGNTPLWIACYKGHRDVALRLLPLGADPAIKNNDVSPPPAPLRHQRCVCGVRGVLGHVCGGRVSGRVLRGTEDLGTEFERPTCPKSLFQFCCHYFRPDKRNISLPSKCLYVFLLMRYSIFHVRNHGVCVVVCCSCWVGRAARVWCGCVLVVHCCYYIVVMIQLLVCCVAAFPSSFVLLIIRPMLWCHRDGRPCTGWGTVGSSTSWIRWWR